MNEVVLLSKNELENLLERAANRGASQALSSFEKSTDTRLYDISEAARELGICTKTLSNYIRQGTVDCTWIGKRARFSRDQLDAIKTRKK